MKKKASALNLSGQLAIAIFQAFRRAVNVALLLCVFLGGAGAGVLYANRNPQVIEIEGHCNVDIPEFLIPSLT